MMTRTCDRRYGIPDLPRHAVAMSARDQTVFVHCLARRLLPAPPGPAGKAGSVWLTFEQWAHLWQRMTDPLIHRRHQG